MKNIGIEKVLNAHLHAIGIAEPGSHDRGSDWSACALEKTKHEVDEKHREVSQRLGNVLQITVNHNEHCHETNARSKQAQAEYGSRTVRVTQPARDKAAQSVGRHKSGIHL